MSGTRYAWTTGGTARHGAPTRDATAAPLSGGGTATGVASTGFASPGSAPPVPAQARSSPALPPVLAAKLPPPLTAELNERLPTLHDGSPFACIEEIRLRAGRYASFTVGGQNVMTDLLLGREDLSDILTALCGGSLYAYSQDIAEGFLTLPDGIRVGVAGRAVCENGRILGVREITGLCIRLPHRHAAVGGELCRLLRRTLAAGGSPRGLLIYAPPGVGKTTLLRGIAVSLSSPPAALRTVVIDTRGELGFDTDDPGLCLDVLTGYPRAVGVGIATRTLNAQVMICDEIGDCDEAMALVSAHHGGVPLVASAHGGTVAELMRRTGIRLLHEARLFSHYVGISRDGMGGFGYAVTAWEEAERMLRDSSL